MISRPASDEDCSWPKCCLSRAGCARASIRALPASPFGLSSVRRAPAQSIPDSGVPGHRITESPRQHAAAAPAEFRARPRDHPIHPIPRVGTILRHTLSSSSLNCRTSSHIDPARKRQLLADCSRRRADPEAAAGAWNARRGPAAPRLATTNFPALLTIDLGRLAQFSTNFRSKYLSGRLTTIFIPSPH